MVTHVDTGSDESNSFNQFKFLLFFYIIILDFTLFKELDIISLFSDFLKLLFNKYIYFN